MSVERSLLKDPRVEASLRRLRSMGLIFEVIELDPNRLTIIIDSESIIRYIVRAVDSRITFKNKNVSYDDINKVMKIYLWR